MIRAIFAMDENWGIGKNGDLPWPRNSADLKWFKDCTNGHSVVMGRKTWESLPYKPLSNRLNFVISSTMNSNEWKNAPHGVYSGDPSKIIKEIIEPRYSEYITWIIGGATLVESCIGIIDELWISNITSSYDCDVFLPKEKVESNFYIHNNELTDSGLSITKWRKK